MKIRKKSHFVILLNFATLVIVFLNSAASFAQQSTRLFNNSDLIGNGAYLYPYGNGDLNRAVLHPLNAVLGTSWLQPATSTTRSAFLSLQGTLYPLTQLIAPIGHNTSVWAVGDNGDVALASWPNSSAGTIQTIIWNPITGQTRPVVQIPAGCTAPCAIRVNSISNTGVFFGSAASNAHDMQGDLYFNYSSLIPVIGIPQQNGTYAAIELNSILHSQSLFTNPLPANENALDFVAASNNNQAIFRTSAIIQNHSKYYLLDWNSNITMTDLTVSNLIPVDIANNGVILLAPNSGGIGAIRLPNGSTVPLTLPTFGSLLPAFPTQAAQCAAPNTTCTYTEAYPNRISSSGRYISGLLNLAIQTTTSSGTLTNFSFIPSVWEVVANPTVTVSAFEPITNFTFSYQNHPCFWNNLLVLRKKSFFTLQKHCI